MISNFLNQKFIQIPAGTVTLKNKRTDPSFIDNQIGYLKIPLDSFYIQNSPVTLREYLVFVNEEKINIDYPIETWINGEWKQNSSFKKANKNLSFPVVGINYYDALRYILWLNKKEKKYSYDLPTEAQFEYSSRAGCICTNSCANSKKIPDKYFRKENFKEELNLDIIPELVNSYGVHGTNGAIWQWCKDWYIPYDSTTKSKNFCNNKKANQIFWRGLIYNKVAKVIRGGSFSYPREYSSCSNRHFSFLTDVNNNLGFRLILKER